MRIPTPQLDEHAEPPYPVWAWFVSAIIVGAILGLCSR